MELKIKHEATLFNWALALLVGVVLLPTLLSIAVGIVSLALWTHGRDIVLGVLVISFAAMVLGGGIGTLALVNKWRHLAKMQADFVSNMSHELKTPLTSICMFAETLRFGKATSPDEVKHCLDIIWTETKKLSTLIDEILIWRKIEASGRKTYVRKPEEIEELVGDALKAFLGIGGELRGKIDFEAESSLPPVLVERHAMIEAIQNVVHNAVKYGGKDSAVKVRLKKGNNRKEVFVEVVDHGMGIPKGDVSKVFDRFFRGESVERAYSGAGLGLSITKHIIKAHGGGIFIDTHEGLGTKVTLVIPAAPLSNEDKSNLALDEMVSTALVGNMSEGRGGEDN